ncbi:MULTISPECIES: hypothetical protein [Vibrio]|uniref:hypothetical protein n=1 Tax=Vibrio TaxID=662 RepID=UPI002075E211|nr:MULTISPECIES: hypothetical protein [Vibrio]USD35451.1 hypothetical protein J8Z27_22795 [Vibrio sp. SCSIO 43186]USD72575.1 hypothetical protein J4N41_22800 [Vibrio sp. SCSIO 43139]USD98969.1 hypothetical protein CTT30_23125 [Vibrio coralliilyticus]
MQNTAQIFDLNAKRIEKQAEQTVSQLLVNMDLPNLSCDALKSVLTMTQSIVYISGGVEYGEPRVVRQAEPEQLIYAASNQLFQYEMFDDRIRVTFDGEYTYDLYLDEHHIGDLNILALVKSALDTESEVRSTQNQIHQRKLMAGFEASMF